MKPNAFFLFALVLGLAACQPAADTAPVQSAAVPAPAPSVPSFERGHAFAQAVCSGCHAIERSSLSPNPKSPPFEDIANRRNLTAETLSTWLRSAHNYPAEMDFGLDPSKADDLAAYIVTLKEENYRPSI